MELRKRGKLQDKNKILAEIKVHGELKRAKDMAATPLSAEIRARYGAIQALQATFAPMRVLTYGEQYERALEAKTPALVCMSNAYGTEAMEAVLNKLVVDTMVHLGAEGRTDARDCMNIARGLVHNRNFRSLSMASVMQFFYRLQTGEISTDEWLRPSVVLRLANKWVATAREMERQAAIEAMWKDEDPEKTQAEREAYRERWEEKKQQVWQQREEARLKALEEAEQRKREKENGTAARRLLNSVKINS